ncbi:hypothetical protein QTP86_033199, partial [Hemibagrus guttatus]
MHCHGEPVPISGIKAGYTLDGVPTHHRAHTHSHSHTTDNLEMPVNLQCMSLDRGRKPEYPEKTPEAPGGNPRGTGRTCKLHTHGSGRNQTPNPGDVRQMCKPPSRQAAKPPSRQAAKPPSRQAAKPPSRQAAKPPSH